MDSYVEWRKKTNIRKVDLPKKEKFFNDLLNIEHSWSGRSDMWGFGNTFIMEAEQLLVNSIVLFEDGYFDCAYYSIRSAIELSTTIVFLADMPEGERDKYLEDWKQSDYFPMFRKMLKLLSTKGNVFTDMKNKMPDFFEFIKESSAQINKYVHKQGYKHFYVSRNHPIAINNPQDNFINYFENHLKRGIAIVAIMRLALDPFPVLLLDEDILYRNFDSLTDPYGMSFVEEYITEYLDSYKETYIYKEAYSFMNSLEKRNRAVFDVSKFHIIDRSKKDEIMSQFSILSKTNRIIASIFFVSEKIAVVYDSFSQPYFSDMKSNRKKQSWGGMEFLDFKKADILTNHPYDEAFISAIKFESECYFIEHNEQLEDKEINSIRISVYNLVGISY